MVTVRGRLQLPHGYAEWDDRDRVRVGNRLVPRAIDVTYPGVGDRPELTMRIEVRDGSPQCVEVRVRALDAGREVRATDMRAVRIEDWVELIVGSVADEVVADDGETVTTVVRLDKRAYRDAVETIRSARKHGRPRVSDDVLRQAADIYRDNILGAPLHAIASAMGVSHRTAARYVQRAREAGYLPETKPGIRRA